jgi:hypothetical protein
VPQSMQVFSSTSAFSLTLIASTGHADAQAAQPVHVALSTFTAITVLPRCTPDTGFPIYLLPLEKKRNTSKIITIIPCILFWFILLHLLFRSSSAKSKIQVHEHKFKDKNDKEIQKRDHNRSWYKPVRKGNRPKEWDEHPNQNQQQDLHDISIFPHTKTDNQLPIKSYFFSFIQR